MTRPRPSSLRGLAFLCLASVVMVFAGPVGATPTASRGPTDWPQYGFDETNTHHNPFETILDSSNVGQVHGLWQAKGGSVGQPALVGGVVYACASGVGRLFAVDASTGTRLWSSRPMLSECDSPAVAAGRVFASDGMRLLALDATTGTELWSASISDEPWGSVPPTVAGDTVYIAGSTGIHAFDTATGVIRWTADTDRTVASPVAVGGGRVYVQTQDQWLIALDAVSGTGLWGDDMGRGAKDFAPVFDNGVVYATGYVTNTLHAVDAAVGTDLWTVDTGCVTGNPTLGEGVLHVPITCGFESGAVAYDALTGVELWRANLPGRSGLPSPIVTANGVAYVGTSSSETDSTYVSMLDAATGQMLARVRLGEEASPQTPIVVNGRIYVAATLSDPPRLYALGL